MGYRPYSSYRKTDVIGHAEIPEHWDLRKATRVFDSIGSGTTPNTSKDDYYDGETPWVTTAELRETTIMQTAKNITEKALQDHSALRLYNPGAVVIAMYGATIGRLGILGVPATVNQACCVFDRSSLLDNRFFYYWLQSFRPVLISLSSGGGQPNLSQDDLRSLRAPVPTLPEQDAIIGFLDHETARIDALIDKKRRLLDLLEEKRLAVTTHAVTRGLDLNAPMKDSGIDWLGQIPTHWGVKKIKYAVSHVVDCLHTTPHYDGDLLYPAVRTADVDRGRLLLEQVRLVSEEVYLERIQRLKPQAGDILYSREGERFGMAALVPTGVDLCLGQRMMMFRVQREFFPSYFMWAMNSEAIYQQVILYTGGATSPHINIKDIINFSIPVPPLSEQSKIADYIDHECARLQRITSRIEDAVTRLLEYRSALITNAVTGKIDVRGEVAKEAAA